MKDPYAAIALAIEEDRIVFSVHADNQLVERGVPRWQAVAGFADGKVIASAPWAKPNPKVCVRQLLPDGTSVVGVWAYVESIQKAKLVTLHYENRP